MQKTIENNWSRAVLTHQIESGLHQREGRATNNFAAAVDAQVRTEGDQPTIGILICKSKCDIVVEYSLRDLNKPIDVREYQI